MAKAKYCDRAYELSIQGFNYNEIQKLLEKDFGYISLPALRSSVKRSRIRNGTQRDCAGNPATNERHNFRDNDDGTRVYNDTTRVENVDEVTPKSVMESKGLLPSEWEVISFVKNSWQQQTKDGEKITLCQSKLTVRPLKKPALTMEEIDEWFENKDFSFPKTPIKSLDYDKSKEVLEIDTADLHCGLLSWRHETGSDFDLHICQEKFLQGINDIVERSKGRQFKAIYFCTLGDILHVDNMQGTTTKGTVQQTDGRVTKIFDFAYDTMRTAVDKLKELNAPIHYIYTCGNHDTVLGYCLAKMLQATIPDVEFDVSPNPQKAIHFGKVIVGLCHADMPKYNRGQWITTDYRREFGESDFAEEHSGHIHTEEAKMYSGVMCRSVMAVCGNSYWEHSMGFRSQRGIMCFVWNTDKGLRETWYYFY